MGTAVDGISTVLRAGLHIDRGAVREGSFADFRYARQQHSPLCLSTSCRHGASPAGQANGVPAAAGAVANAYARATRTRPRRFPINF